MSSSTTFDALGVPAFICDALRERNITTPFAIQAATVADTLAGRDVLGRAPTGSGKTLAFGVPLIAQVAEHGRRPAGRPIALVLAPTRELAEQITTELRSFSGRLRVDAVYGGVGYGAQVNALRRGVDVLVACPGRLEDLIQRRDVDLGDVRFVVLDEADRMADMGFVPAVRRLLDQTSSERQTLLFSATLDGDVAKLTRDYQDDPVRHEVGEETPDVRAATHKFFTVERLERNPIVVEVVNAAWPSIIFTRTRHGADRLAKQLGKLGVHAAPIHGGRSQNQRNRALDDFTNGRVHALVATDVAARGIHVDGVASVIHYDPPEDHKTYVHRSGRTARAGADGLVVSLVQGDQQKDVRKMQRQIGLDEPFESPVSGELHRDVPAGAQAGERVLAPSDDAAPGLRSTVSGSKQRNRTGRNATRPSERGLTHDHRDSRRGGEGHRNDRRDRDGEGRSGSGRRGGERHDRGDGHGNDRRDREDASRSGSGRRGDRRDRGDVPEDVRSGRREGDRARRSGERRDGAEGHRKAGERGGGTAAGRGRGSKPDSSDARRAGATSGRGKQQNRKARRAHLQPGATSRSDERRR